ncbi:MFS transporter [Pedosphaera parvula]|uniref:Major facilitator superfamily MFS_1 n=1 Tax=Pedosphaera parvula (strain Ellin514) TaxID=320771 RepID=B9XJZ1_PEDPL|nr:MFS transporter [Pedosphaera parvula]EEF59814.1 major facilitator superfamily MFS_1 [Pedosphaera parvula Ellin514]
MSKENQPGGSHWTLARERLLLLTLAAIQFTTILDFLIIMPLGPQYMRVFSIDPKQFGLIVSSYGISAGVAGLAAGFFLDRFDRKRALLWLYLGFGVGTLFCAMAYNYQLLVASRFFAGAFGGVVGAVILAIVGDVIPMERRGAAMGMVMSAFSVSSIVGVPLGLLLASHYNWHVPFYALTVLSFIILIIAAWITPPLRGHLAHHQDQHPFARTLTVMMHPDHQKAFLFMAALTCAGFAVFPYISTYMVSNVGLTETQLPLIYLCGGLCTLYSMNWVGRWADRAGKLRVFTITSLTTAVPILLVTNLPRVPVVAAVATSTLLMVCMSARMVPAMAMMTGAVEARYRGGFMSINSAVQQLSMGVTAFLGGYIVQQKTPTSPVTHFPINGFISIACAYGCIYLARFLKAPVKKEVAAEPVLMEG